MKRPQSNDSALLFQAMVVESRLFEELRRLAFNVLDARISAALRVVAEDHRAAICCLEQEVRTLGFGSSVLERLDSRFTGATPDPSLMARVERHRSAAVEFFEMAARSAHRPELQALFGALGQIERSHASVLSTAS